MRMSPVPRSPGKHQNSQAGPYIPKLVTVLLLKGLYQEGKEKESHLLL